LNVFPKGIPLCFDQKPDFKLGIRYDGPKYHAQSGTPSDLKYIIVTDLFNLKDFSIVIIEKLFFLLSVTQSTNFLNPVCLRPPLTLLDRAEIFTIDSWKYSTEMKLAIIVFDPPIRTYRILKAKHPDSRPNLYVFLSQNGKEVRFTEKLKVTSEI
jgi:hypothetical protein